MSAGSPIRAGVLTVSDRCSRGEAIDTSGPALCVMLRERLGAVVEQTACVPDERERICEVLVRWSRLAGAVDLVLTAGGTGLAPRDVTPEAARSVIEREHPGLLELARIRCLAITPRTFLSRGVSGTIGRTLVITLPGSQRGCMEMLGALLDILPHAVETLRGEVRDDGRDDAGVGGESGRVIHHER